MQPGVSAKQLLVVCSTLIMIFVVYASFLTVQYNGVELASAAASDEDVVITTTIVNVTEIVDDDDDNGVNMTWSYSGKYGPDNWGTFWPLCSHGSIQSPVNVLESQSVFDPTLGQISWRFDPPPRGAAKPVTTFDDSSITVDNWYAQLEFYHEIFALDSVEFHVASGHEINGKEYGIELDLIHLNKDGSKVLIVALLFDRVDLNNNNNNIKGDAFVDEIQKTFKPWQQWKEGEQVAAPTQQQFQQFLSQVSNGGKFEYFQYFGSLQEPPCSEDVTWIVSRHAHATTIGQINKFLAITTENHRPVQPLNGRPIFRNWDFQYTSNK